MSHSEPDDVVGTLVGCVADDNIVRSQLGGTGKNHLPSVKTDHSVDENVC